MSWRLASNTLKYLPAGAGSGVIAWAGIDSDFKDKLAVAVAHGLTAMNAPLVAVSVVAAVLVYAAGLIVCEVMANKSERPAPNLVMSHHSMAWGGQVPGMPDLFLLFAELSVGNIGNMPSAIPARDWGLGVKIGSEWVPVPIWAIEQDFTVGSPAVSVNIWLQTISLERQLTLFRWERFAKATSPGS